MLIWIKYFSNFSRNSRKPSNGILPYLAFRRRRRSLHVHVTTRQLPDLTGIDPTELQLMILAVLDRRGIGPEFRKIMHAQFGAAIDAAGGAGAVLQAALGAGP